MSGLTPSELEILRLASFGHSVPEIAKKQGTTRRTVERRIESAAEKLGATNLPSAVANAIRRGLIDGEA